MALEGTTPLTQTAPHQGGSLGRCHVRVVEGPERGVTVELGAEPVLVGTTDQAALKLTDPRVSRRHLQLQAGSDAVLVKDLASRNGTWFEGSRVLEIALPPGALIRVGDSWLQLVSTERATGVAPSGRTRFGGLEGQSRVMRQLFTSLERAAASDFTVLLQGPTGSGKELAARSLHDAGPRAKNDFVVVDCSAITASLLHAALFGHGAEAFTGAISAKKGAFERAHQGTLFIDEVAALPLELQPLLLRFLDRGELTPLGTGAVVKVDVRVVAATREELPGLVAQGAFREDLFYRLNVVTLDLPPLRARGEDIPLLVLSLLTKLAVAQPGPIAGAHSDADNVGLGQRYISYRNRVAGDSLYGNAISPVQDAGQLYDTLMQRITLICNKQSTQPGADNTKLRAALTRKKSLIDFKLDDIKTAKTALGLDSEHSRKLDGLVEGWREVETLNTAQLAALDAGTPTTTTTPACPPFARPTGNGTNQQNLDQVGPVHDQMIALIKLAFEWDLTRVVAFTLSGASSGQSLPSRGVAQAHHNLEHSNNVAALNTMGTYYSEKYAALLAALNGIDDGGGKTALYNSSVVLGMECWSNSSSGHFLTNIPFILGGQGGGKFQTGRIVNAAGRNNNDLLISVQNACGLQSNVFGLQSLCQGPIV